MKCLRPPPQNPRLQSHQVPDFDDLASHFESLYQVDEKDDLKKITELKSEVHVPVLDDPITPIEVNKAVNMMKNGGYDHKIDAFLTIYSVLAPLLTLLMNILFYVAYPTTLAISLLSALPKKGNLRLSMNYRGIQMLKAMSALYDRILENRLNLLGMCAQGTISISKRNFYHPPNIHNSFIDCHREEN